MVARESVGRLGKLISRSGYRVAGFFALALVAGCGQSDTSGEYLAKFNNGAAFLHLVETPDKRITGELDTAFVQPDGRIQYQDMAVTGAADGSAVSLSLKPDAFLSATVPISGTFAWGKLTMTGPLSGDQSSPTIFSHSDSGEYQEALTELKEQSQEIRQANAAAAARAKAAQQEREFVAATNTLVAQMERFDTAAAGDIDGLPAYQSRIQAITTKMDSYLAREKQLSGNPDAAVVRGQLSVTVSQGMVATDQLLNNVRVLEAQFQANALPLMQRVVATSQSCHWVQRPDGRPGAWASACLNVVRAVPAFTRNYENLRGALQALEAHYATTHETQQRLVDASQSLE